MPIFTMDTVSDLIVATFSIKNQSLTITEIAQQSGLNRHTVAKNPDIPEHKDNLIFTCEDDGVGIPSEEKDRK